MALVKEDEMVVEREETVACKSVAEGGAMEAIFMLSGETMTMNPRDSEHRQQSTMVVMEEEDILAAMEEIKRAAVKEVVAHASITKGAAMKVLFLSPKETMTMTPRTTSMGSRMSWC